MKNRLLATATLAAVLTAPAVPAFADSMGGWMGSAPSCVIRFISRPDGIEARYTGLRNGVEVDTKAMLPKDADLEAVAAVLGNTPDCSQAAVYGM